MSHVRIQITKFKRSAKTHLIVDHQTFYFGEYNDTDEDGVRDRSAPVSRAKWFARNLAVALRRAGATVVVGRVRDLTPARKAAR